MNYIFDLFHHNGIYRWLKGFYHYSVLSCQLWVKLL